MWPRAFLNESLKLAEKVNKLEAITGYSLDKLLECLTRGEVEIRRTNHVA